MAWKFSGNISGTVDSVPQGLPMLVDNFLLVNKTAGTIGVSVYMIGNSGLKQISMMPWNKQLSVGEVYENTREFVMLATEKIRVITSGSCDYDFTILNTEAPDV